MAPPHRFTAARDGTSIAFRVAGIGSTALVFTNGFATSDFYWKHLARHFQDHATVVTWDLKGHGRSARARSMHACGVPDSADDLQRVMDAAGIEKATLVGFSLGCQVIFEAWKQAPDRVEALVPILGTYGRPFDNLIHPRVGPVLYEVFKRAGPRAAPVLIGGAYVSMRTPVAHFVNQMFGMIGRDLDRHEMRPFYDHFALIDPKTWAAMGLAAQDHSAREFLAEVSAPTLVIAGGRDAFTPLALSEEMHREIEDCELLLLPEATHSGLFEYPDQIVAAVDEFLRTRGLLDLEETGGRRAV